MNLFLFANFHNCWGFSPGSHLRFVLVGFEHNMKVAFQVKTSLFSGTVNFKVNVRIDILENTLVPSKIILE